MERGSDLHRRAELAYAQLVVDDVDPAEAVMLACDLLAADLDGEATVALAIASTRSLAPYAAERMLRDMLDEVGIPEPEPGRAAQVATACVCARIIDGTLSVAEGGHRLLGTLAQLADADPDADSEAVGRLLRLLDRLEYDLGGVADPAFREDLHRLASDIAADLRGREQY
ncbi:hypothetical protein [Plantactinospora soyae]|uniref:Uncharacterized protein n=1 Tax=Plantactinospora soyae TaxID=1544732 RepID=A0A927LZ41_9ACTN|nr:hypothetical protein [Plantactinospora soyae]MBE1484579.1 hypothetical protein [Plantactinospora soyae]